MVNLKSHVENGDSLHCETTLDVHQLAAGYPGKRAVIHDINFSLREGERVAVIGPNGAGKTTLFKALVGLLPHSEGHISLGGRDCVSSHTMIGYVPQQEAIDWNFPVTVYDVVMMGRTRKIGWFRWPRAHDHLTVESALEQVGMMPFRDRQIGALSGGQRRRVFIARALAQESELLLLDEPFGGVDVAAEEEILRVLDNLSRAGMTILLATHNLDVAATRFDRLLLLKETVIAFGTPAEVLQPSLLKRAYGDRVSVIKSEDSTIVVADYH
jgi:ABC-type Mn2+/Zn2+ transport system ATPase subunit